MERNAALAARILERIAERGESLYAAAIGAGVAPKTLRALASGTPNTPTLEKLARYLDLDLADLLALRVADPERVARGRAVGKLTHSTAGAIAPEVRAAIAAAGGRAMAAKAGADHYRAMQRAAIEARKASGAWFTAKGAERHRESARASGAKAGATTLERHGREHFQRIGKAAGAAKAAESIWVLCVLCANPERPLYRTKYDQQARPQPYHHDCYKEWRRTDAQRERSRKLGALGQIRQRVKAHGDAGLLAEVDAKIAAELRRLRDPSQAGRPAKLLDNKSLAIGMARMQHEGKMSAAEVAKVYGMATAPIDGTGEPEPTGNAYRLLRLGRALLGYDRLPGGPRRKAA